MQDLKNYLNERRQFLQEVANADASEDALSVLGQIHEIKVILNWIDEHENAGTNETPTDAYTSTTNTNEKET
jgi:hypothetical protein